MWADVGYMNNRSIFTLDQDRFPLHRLREIISHLHLKNQHFILIIDPAISYKNYLTFNRATEDDVLLKDADGSIHKGVVWPGITASVDWSHPNITTFWSREFRIFFDKDTGVDIDGVWIDMNEPANVRLKNPYFSTCCSSILACKIANTSYGY